MRSILLVLLVATLTACSNPMDTPLPKEPSNMASLKPIIEKLKPEDKELLVGYVMRYTIGAAFGKAFGVGGEPIPDRMTVGKAIEDQRGFAAKQKADAEAKKVAMERAEAARKTLAAQMGDVLLVRLTMLSLHKATFHDGDVQSQINMAFDVENKGTKDISGIKGIASFRDKFGDTISSMGLKTEEVIPAGKTINIRLGKDYNQFRPEDRKLANADAANVVFELAPEIVLFADGTKFEASMTTE